MAIANSANKSGSQSGMGRLQQALGPWMNRAFQVTGNYAPKQSGGSGAGATPTTGGAGVGINPAAAQPTTGGAGVGINPAISGSGMTNLQSQTSQQPQTQTAASSKQGSLYGIDFSTTPFYFSGLGGAMPKPGFTLSDIQAWAAQNPTQWNQLMSSPWA